MIVGLHSCLSTHVYTYVPLTVGGLTITILPEEPVVREGDTAQLVCIATGTPYYPTPLHTYTTLSPVV